MRNGYTNNYRPPQKKRSAGWGPGFFCKGPIGKRAVHLPPGPIVENEACVKRKKGAEGKSGEEKPREEDSRVRETLIRSLWASWPFTYG